MTCTTLRPLACTPPMPEVRAIQVPGRSPPAGAAGRAPVTRWRALPRGLALCLAMVLAGCAGVSTTYKPSPAVASAAHLPAPPAPEPVVVAPAVVAPVRKPPEAVSNQPPLSQLAQAPAPLSSSVLALAAPVDIWDRIRRGFALPDLQNDLVRDREQWYATRPDYMQRMTERANRYLFHIVEEVERRNLPMELALLPFIESAFNPQAVSSARAAGMWQFMPATGQSFDLRQNAFRDDRRDVLASTRAALDYLEQLHARFGDWHLALAAYNWGQGNVSRVISRNQGLGLPTGYTDIDMPAETRLYVPKLQAVKNILAQPEAFGVRLPSIGNHPFFDTLTIQRDIDVALIARLAEVNEADFRALNPSIRQPVVMAAGTPNILLPWDNAQLFERRLAEHRGPLASWTAWVVPSTMTAADAARRVGMSESSLRSVNSIPPGMKVVAGSSLLVPRSAELDRDVSEFVADNARLGFTPEIVLRPTSVKARKGDTLATLASRYGVRAAQVADWNDLPAGAKLKSGQRLVLMLPVRVGARQAARTAPERSARDAKPARASVSRRSERASEGNRGARASVKPTRQPAASPRAAAPRRGEKKARP